MTNITLPLRHSTIIAGPRTPDTRDLHAARIEMRELAQEKMQRSGETSCEVFACRRHGGCVVDVVESEQVSP